MKLKALAAIAAATPLMVACGSNQTAEVKEPFKLNGAGASFPAAIYNSWLGSFAKETGNQVNYQAVGSGAGVRQFKAKTVDFGAFVNFIGNRDGLVHISELTDGRVAKVTDVINEGDEVKVKVLAIDERGKVRLSMRVVDQETGEERTSGDED